MHRGLAADATLPQTTRSPEPKSQSLGRWAKLNHQLVIIKALQQEGQGICPGA